MINSIKKGFMMRKKLLKESETMLYRVVVVTATQSYKAIFVNEIEASAIHSLLVQKCAIDITLDEVISMVGELIANKVVNNEALEIGMELKVFEANEFCEDDEIYPQDDAPMEDEFVDNEVMSDVSSDISVDSDDSLSESAYRKYF